jgi:hypothetical protein
MGISARGGLNPVSGFYFPVFSIELPRKLPSIVENHGRYQYHCCGGIMLGDTDSCVFTAYIQAAVDRKFCPWIDARVISSGPVLGFGYLKFALLYKEGEIKIGKILTPRAEAFFKITGSSLSRI